MSYRWTIPEVELLNGVEPLSTLYESVVLPLNQRSKMQSGDAVSIFRSQPKPKWWQLWRLFTYYILRRRIRTTSTRVSRVVDSTTIELEDGAALTACSEPFYISVSSTTPPPHEEHDAPDWWDPLGDEDSDSISYDRDEGS